MSRSQQELVRRAMTRGSWCTLATASAQNRPHVVGVLYVAVDDIVYVNTFDTTIKARNVRENPRVAVCIPVRRYPFVPPYAVQFQGTAEILSPQDTRIVELVGAGRLKRITSHGELDQQEGCFIRITPARRVSTYGLGVSLRTLLRDPFGAQRSVELRLS